MKPKAYRIQATDQAFVIIAINVSKTYSEFCFYLTGTGNRAWVGTTLKGGPPLSSIASPSTSLPR